MTTYQYSLPDADHASLLDHYRLGRLYRFPWCCVLMFCLRHLFRCHRKHGPWGWRVHPVTGLGSQFALCMVIHRTKGDNS